MSAESIKENAVRKVIQELIVPDLKEIKNKIGILEERISSVNNELKADINRLDEKIDIKITALDDKIDSFRNELKADINRLDEKIDLMNKFNERLFNLIHPAGQK